MRRAAISVASNIAQGCGRSSDRDFARFIAVSLRSVRWAGVPAVDLGFVAERQILAAIDLTGDVRRLLIGLRKSLLAN